MEVAHSSNIRRVSVSLASLIYLLHVKVEAVKAQQTQIDELKAENDALKTQIQKIYQIEAMLKELQAQN